MQQTAMKVEISGLPEKITVKMAESLDFSFLAACLLLSSGLMPC